MLIASTVPNTSEDASFAKTDIGSLLAVVSNAWIVTVEDAQRNIPIVSNAYLGINWREDNASENSNQTNSCDSLFN